MTPSLPAVLHGEARQEALQQLHLATVRTLRKDCSESEIVEAASKDPSLLLERPFPPYNLAGSYLEIAYRNELLGTLEIAFRAGIHPDDRSVFDGRTVLERSRADRLPGPELVALALRYGASANPSPYVSLARAYVEEMHRLRSSDLWAISDHLRSLRQLLDAGPGRLDPQEGSAKEGFLLYLASCPFFATALPEARPLIEDGHQLIRLAAKRGADVNWKHAGLSMPTVWDMVHRGRCRAAAALLELGAEPRWNERSDLEALAAERGGPEGAALIREALMRRRIGQHQAQAGVESPATRRPMVL